MRKLKTNWQEKLADDKGLPKVVEVTGRLNPEFPGGVAEQGKRLKSEGHIIEPGRGKQPPRVAGYDRRLAKFRVSYQAS